MSVELPFAPVDSIIRRNAGDLRVSADAAEELARRIQTHGAALAAEAAERADADGRRTVMASDFGVDPDAAAVPDPDGLALPIAPVDRIARLDVEDRVRIGSDARVVLAARLEGLADEAAAGAARLARHAGRRTVQAEDVETYFAIAGPDAD